MNKRFPTITSIIVPVLFVIETPAAEKRKERVMRALRVQEKIVIDGELDELGWGLAEPATDFIQRLTTRIRPGSRSPGRMASRQGDSAGAQAVHARSKKTHLKTANSPSRCRCNTRNSRPICPLREPFRRRATS
jgi:hypothetical protein